MKILCKERGQGKTTALIHTSAITGYRILTHTEIEANRIAQKAEEKGYKIPAPMSCASYFLHNRGLKDEGIMIDNLDLYLESILTTFFDVPVKAVTMSKENLV